MLYYYRLFHHRHLVLVYRGSFQCHHGYLVTRCYFYFRMPHSFFLPFVTALLLLSIVPPSASCHLWFKLSVTVGIVLSNVTPLLHATFGFLPLCGCSIRHLVYCGLLQVSPWALLSLLSVVVQFLSLRGLLPNVTFFAYGLTLYICSSLHCFFSGFSYPCEPSLIHFGVVRCDSIGVRGICSM